MAQEIRELGELAEVELAESAIAEAKHDHASHWNDLLPETRLSLIEMRLLELQVAAEAARKEAVK